MLYVYICVCVYFFIAVGRQELLQWFNQQIHTLKQDPTSTTNTTSTSTSTYSAIASADLVPALVACLQVNINIYIYTNTYIHLYICTPVRIQKTLLTSLYI